LIEIANPLLFLPVDIARIWIFGSSGIYPSKLENLKEELNPARTKYVGNKDRKSDPLKNPPRLRDDRLGNLKKSRQLSQK